MIFPRACDPTLCTGDGSRYSIDYVALDFYQGKPVLAATDGRMLVVIPVATSEEGESLGNVVKLIPPDAIALARKAAKSLRKPDARLELNGSIEVEAKEGKRSFPYGEERFPQWQTIPPTTAPVASVMLNAEYLVALQRAMGASAVRLCVHYLTKDGAVDSTMPLTVRPVGLTLPAPTALGVMMPLAEDA